MHTFTMGYGDNDTHREDRIYKFGPRAGEKHPDAGKPYGTINYLRIVAMAEAQKTLLIGLPKDAGPWMQASNYNGFDARFGDAQKANGKFTVMAADIDAGNPTLEILQLIVRRTLGEVRFLIWSTASSTEALKKWRVLVPLTLAMSAMGYRAIQHVWFEHLHECGVKTDPAFEKPSQIIYLPNRGAHYECYEHQAPLCDPRNYSRLGAVVDFRATLGLAPTTVQNDETTALANVCRAFDLQTVMLAGGYEQGPGLDLRSPFSSSRKGWAVKLYPNGTWVSQHDGDRGTIGKPTEGGNTRGDVVDVLETCHGWEPKVAVAVGNIIMAGFNPSGIAFAAVPRAALHWWARRKAELRHALAAQFGI